MLTEIKRGVNVPVETPVVAINKNNEVKTGVLREYGHGNWVCLDDTPVIMQNVTHFITNENLVKAK